MVLFPFYRNNSATNGCHAYKSILNRTSKLARVGTFDLHNSTVKVTKICVRHRHNHKLANFGDKAKHSLPLSVK